MECTYRALRSTVHIKVCIKTLVYECITKKSSEVDHKADGCQSYIIVAHTRLLFFRVLSATSLIPKPLPDFTLQH